MHHRRRVTFITTFLAVGGAEKQLASIVFHLKSKGWEVSVLSMMEPRAYTNELGEKGIPCVSLGMRRKLPDPRGLLRAVRFIRRFQPSIVCSFLFHANLLGRAAASLTRVPIMVSSARNEIEGPRWFDFAYRLTDPLSDVTTHVSMSGIEKYVRTGAVPRHKILYMPNGVDSKTYAPNHQRRTTIRAEMHLRSHFVWLAAGRFEREKDLPTLLHAFQAVAHNHPEARLMLVGNGSLAEPVRISARQLGLTNTVLFPGIRRDMPAIYNAADAYVMSSAWEGTPNVLLEAASSGLPIVATDVGDNRYIVPEGTSGYLVPPRDSEALSAAMNRIMILPQMVRRRVGEAGRRHIQQNYQFTTALGRWENLFLQLLRRE